MYNCACRGRNEACDRQRLRSSKRRVSVCTFSCLASKKKNPQLVEKCPLMFHLDAFFRHVLHECFMQSLDSVGFDLEQFFPTSSCFSLTNCLDAVLVSLFTILSVRSPFLCTLASNLSISLNTLLFSLLVLELDLLCASLDDARCTRDMEIYDNHQLVFELRMTMERFII